MTKGNTGKNGKIPETFMNFNNFVRDKKTLKFS